MNCKNRFFFLIAAIFLYFCGVFERKKLLLKFISKIINQVYVIQFI